MRNIMFPSTLMDEEMAHHFYPQEEEVGFDHQSKRDVLPLSHVVRGDGQQDIGERGTPCVSPTPELDGKNRNSTRRRIQVACNRCRKRKIKCSGDIGDGQGCSNCRSSGNPNCQFLRVNSSMLQTKVTGWPYPNMNATMAPSQRVGLYALSMAPKVGVLPTNSPGIRAASFSRASSYEMGPTDPQQAYSRSSLVDHTMNYEDDSSAAYSSPSSAYMIPSAHQSVLAEYCGLSWTKAWGSNMNANRGPNGGLLSENDAESTAHQSAYSYMLSGQGTASTDPSLASSMALLSDTQGPDRTLPNPTTRNQQMNLTAFSASPETIAGLAHSQEYRVGQHWAAKAGPVNNSRSIQPTSIGAFSTSPINRTKSLPSNTQDMVFGFIPMTTTGSPSPMIPSCGQFSGLDPVDPEDFRTNGDVRLTRSYSRDNTSGRLLSLSEYGSDIYGYSSTEKRKCSDAGDHGSATTLINGLPYTRPKHPEHPFSTDSMPDFREATEVHRTPVSALSNPGGF